MITQISKMENILLEYQKTIPKSSRIIENISHIDFYKQLDNLDKLGELNDSTIADIFRANLERFPIPNIFFQNTKYGS